MKNIKNKLAAYWVSSGIVKDKRIIEAFKSVPRELFVLKEYEEEAYGDFALPICAGQTIS
ncbi:MAG: protein-L-isoaspartate O-methyltransferase, partial [Candidatus Woesearchaeota archaeon]|nr:protein-L-isoaspartate O-methyltransferase [Candidatus Woesearchaeota archaeon]